MPRQLLQTGTNGIWLALLFADHSVAGNTIDVCMRGKIGELGPETTIGELRALCETQTRIAETTIHAPEGVGSRSATISSRIHTELANRERGYVMTPHHPNYLLPYTNNSEAGADAFKEIDPSVIVDDSEAMIQVSVKFPISVNLWNSDTDLMIAYTNRAWWQVYNDEFSKPFRETNYEPELFLRHYHFDGDEKWYTPLMVDFGYNHQSNGREEPLSRSWDRIFATGFFQLTPSLALSLRTWYRLPENDGDDELAGEYRYLGYGDARAVYTFQKNTFTLMARPGTEKLSMEATWSYPIADHIRFMAYYYNGYGETLLDYKRKSNRIGIGFSLNDYLVNN